MKTRTLRRKVIIREYDYEKVYSQAFAPLAHLGLDSTLYDRAEFIPLTKTKLEHENLIELLKESNRSNPYRNSSIIFVQCQRLSLQ
jgi:hypothetical protein